MIFLGLPKNLTKSPFIFGHVLHDFEDFVQCVSNMCDVLTIQHLDFSLWEHGLSESKVSKESRPLLANVCVAEIRKGSMNIYFKIHDEDNDEFTRFYHEKG